METLKAKRLIPDPPKPGNEITALLILTSINQWDHQLDATQKDSKSSLHSSFTLKWFLTSLFVFEVQKFPSSRSC